MNIHNLWFLCIIVRLLLIFAIVKLSKNKNKKIFIFIIMFYWDRIYV